MQWRSRNLLPAHVVLALGVVLCAAGLRVAEAREPLEEQAWRAYTEREAVTARRLGEALLAEHPNDVVGHFVLGQALYWGEGDLPGARRHLERSIELFDEGIPPRHREAWEVHAYGLTELAGVLHAMDDREAELAIYDLHDAKYDPDMPGDRVWPLMKLGRLDEAREWADIALVSDRAWDRTAALTSLCAMEGLQGDRASYVTACRNAFNDSKLAGIDIAVDAHNLGLALTADFQFDEATATVRQALSSSGRQISNPHAQLAFHAARRGDLAEGAQRFRKAQAWNLKLPPSLRGQTRAGLRASAATLLLTSQHLDVARGLIDRAIDSPDRQGFSSVHQIAADGSHALLRQTVRRLQNERQLEAASSGSWPERAAMWLWQLLPDPQAWADRATVRQAATDSHVGDYIFQPYRWEGFAEVPYWLLMECVHDLGPGVARAALDQAVEVEAQTPEDAERMKPLFDLWRAELSWRSGDDDAAIEAATTGLEALPDALVMHATRARAVRAAARMSQGRTADAVEDWRAVMAVDPGLVRRLGVALPVRASGDPADVARLLASPRFVEDDAGFEVSVRNRADGVQACLTVRTTPVCGEGEGPREALNAVHEVAFSVDLGLGEAEAWALGDSKRAEQDRSFRRLGELIGLKTEDQDAEDEAAP